MKIYTKTGDGGSTSLYDGTKVSKNDQILNCIGNIDELNSEIGLLIAYIKSDQKFEYIIKHLIEMQSILFDIGANIANPSDKKPIHFDNDGNNVRKLEQDIDAMTVELPKLVNFILPGGSIEMAVTHKIRTICRRAERSLVDLYNSNHQKCLIYMNRLSDYFFTLARYIGMLQKEKEVLYVSNIKK